VETGWFTSLAESSKEGYGSKRAVLSMMMMIIYINNYNKKLNLAVIY
jgi:hypothetical protein